MRVGYISQFSRDILQATHMERSFDLKVVTYMEDMTCYIELTLEHMIRKQQRFYHLVLESKGYVAGNIWPIQEKKKAKRDT